jgi:ABC-type multidrug transport system ATPase subunit
MKQLKVSDISKKYNLTTLFKDVTFCLSEGTSLALTGPNGSGKSTLLQILGCLKKPTSGNVQYTMNGTIIDPDEIHQHIGFCAPIVNPYDELTAEENLQFALRTPKSTDEILSLLEQFNLADQRDKHIRHYSSGMKQRLKYILALINDPPVLLLDEPGSNLDRKGKEAVYSHIDSLRGEKIIVIATNEPEEAKLCEKELRLGE